MERLYVKTLGVRNVKEKAINEIEKNRIALHNKRTEVVKKEFEQLKDFDLEQEKAAENYKKILDSFESNIKILGAGTDEYVKQLELGRKIHQNLIDQRKDLEDVVEGRKLLAKAEIEFAKREREAGEAAQYRNKIAEAVADTYSSQLSLLKAFYDESKQLIPARPGGDPALLKKSGEALAKVATALKTAREAAKEFEKQLTPENLTNIKKALIDLGKAIEIHGKIIGKGERTYFDKETVEKLISFNKDRIDLQERFIESQKELIKTQEEQKKAEIQLNIMREKIAKVPDVWKEIAKNSEEAAFGIRSLAGEMDAMLKLILPHLREASELIKILANNANVNMSKGGLVGKKFATGGPVGTDTIPAWLSPGEYIWDAKTVKTWYPLIKALHQTPKYMAAGGAVTNIGDINISVKDSGDATTTVRAIAAQLKREVRRGTFSFN